MTQDAKDPLPEQADLPVGGGACELGEADTEADSRHEAFPESAGRDAPTSGKFQSKAQRDEMWEARRRFNNLRRREKAKEVRKARNAAARDQDEALLAAMTEDQAAEWRAQLEAERRQRSDAAAAQAERVAAALAGGGPGGGPDAALRVVIDCSFSPTAPPKEMRSLCKQIENSSAINKRYPRPACLTLTSWGEPLASVAAPSGAAGWSLVKVAASAVEAFGADRVVVLSPDSAEPLTTVDNDHAYVIGGIVDRSHQKGLTLKYAESHRVPCKRLPIAEHAEQLGLGKGTRKCPVLNVDDVVRALLIAHNTGDWVQALDAAIPSRKRKPQTAGFTVSTAQMRGQEAVRNPGEKGSEAVGQGEVPRQSGGAEAEAEVGWDAPGFRAEDGQTGAVDGNEEPSVSGDESEGDGDKDEGKEAGDGMGEAILTERGVSLRSPQEASSGGSAVGTAAAAAAATAALGALSLGPRSGE